MKIAMFIAPNITTGIRPIINNVIDATGENIPINPTTIAKINPMNNPKSPSTASLRECHKVIRIFSGDAVLYPTA